MIKIPVVFVCVFLVSSALVAQDTLPKFTVSTKGNNNRVLISWTNNYRSVSQISIQRSADSLKNFKTILSVPDASIQQNGFVDTKAATLFQFYRLFIVLDSGKYVFTDSKRPFWDTARVSPKSIAIKRETNGSKRVIYADSISLTEADKLNDKATEKTENVTAPVPEKYFVVQRLDSILFRVPQKNLKSFRDSLLYKTKDTLVFRSADTILIKTFVPKEVFKPSVYVFTEKDGNVSISLPDVSSKHYSVKFFDENNNLVFEINKVKDTMLTLDKSNFLHAGWFRFELYEDSKLKEKNKFFVPKEF